MRSVNEFANQITHTYATVANAQLAVDKACKTVASWSDKQLIGSQLILQRTIDGRFAVIIVNPHHELMHFWAERGFGVFGITA